MVDLKLKLPDGYLCAEDRDGFWVDSKRKEVWAVELDLLAELLRVCRKHGIKIFASGGTLLGAVRHGGFVPWDDDIDMMMFREDYNKLCDIAQAEFLHPYFFQTEYTDPGSLRGHAQLRNTETTAILERERSNARFNQGIFIDIFPLDDVVSDISIFEHQSASAEKYIRKASRYAGLSTRYECRGIWYKRLIKKLMHTVFYTACRKKEIDSYRKFENCCQMNNTGKTPFVSTLSLSFSEKKYIKKREDFANICELKFEFLTIPAGSGYKSALQNRYGDYMKHERNTNLHGNIFFDTERPYSVYLS